MAAMVEIIKQWSASLSILGLVEEKALSYQLGDDSSASSKLKK